MQFIIELYHVYGKKYRKGPMTKVYLIRHAEAEGNLYRRAQGQYNSNITQLGRRQLAAVAERFREVHLDAILSSDLYRTVSTANAVLKYHPELTLHTTPRLREVNVGVWENTPWGNIAADYPEQLDWFTGDPARWSVPGSEPYVQVRRRIRETVTEFAEAHPGQTVAVVSHGFAIRSMLCDILDIPSAEISRMPYGDNTAVTLVTEENGNYTIDWLNDNSHLVNSGLSTFERQSWWRRDSGGQGKQYARLEAMNPSAEKELYCRCYENTWMASHGNLKGYIPSIYLSSAKTHATLDPGSVMKLILDGQFAGIIELDPERGAKEGSGWISLLYVEPAFRDRRLGMQLIGHAVAWSRRRDRSKLQLHVSETNETALAFYKQAGFTIAEKEAGVGGDLYRMEMDITRRILTPDEIG